MLDAEGEPLRLGLEAEPFLVSPNQREAEALVGQEFYEQQDFAYALEHIAELGARNVLITNESGCFARLREGRKTRRFRVLAPQVEPVSAVGAATCSSRASSRRVLDERSTEDALRSLSPRARPRRSSSARAASTRATRRSSTPDVQLTDFEAVTSDR